MIVLTTRSCLAGSFYEQVTDFDAQSSRSETLSLHQSHCMYIFLSRCSGSQPCQRVKEDPSDGSVTS